MPTNKVLQTADESTTATLLGENKKRNHMVNVLGSEQQLEIN
jgi:hypothetical protein